LGKQSLEYCRYPPKEGPYIHHSWKVWTRRNSSNPFILRRLHLCQEHGRGWDVFTKVHIGVILESKSSYE
jgi:hypothetical protein